MQRFFLIALCAAGLATAALAEDSGQRTFANVTVEPAVDNVTGAKVYLATQDKSASSNASDSSTAPVYLTMYPLSSTLNAADLNCQPNNCEHVNVLPFQLLGYDNLQGTSKACVDFNGGNPCALVKGHDHLLGVASLGGDPKRTCAVQLVIFTQAGVEKGVINTRVRTVDQISTLIANGDAFIVNTGIQFHCSIVPERLYELGTPVVIQFP